MVIEDFAIGIMDLLNKIMAEKARICCCDTWHSITLNASEKAKSFYMQSAEKFQMQPCVSIVRSLYFVLRPLEPAGHFYVYFACQLSGGRQRASVFQ